MPEWFETMDDRMWLRPDKGGEKEAAFVKRALRLRTNQRALYAPCGAGRVSLPLARSGIDVVGMDIRRTFVDSRPTKSRLDGSLCQRTAPWRTASRRSVESRADSPKPSKAARDW